MRFPSVRLQTIAGLALALGLTACDGDTTEPVSTPTNLSAAEADMLGTAFEDETDVSLGALLYGGTLNNADLSMSVLASPAMNGAPPRPGLECLVIEPMPPEDPDQDGVPTRLLVTFDPQPCVVPTDRGVSFLFTGALSVGDPTPLTAAYDLDERYERFGHGVAVEEGRSFLLVRDGDRHVRQEGSGIGAEEAFTSIHVVNEQVHRRAAAEWGLRFAGDETILFGQPFPSGHLAINGTWAFSHDRGDRRFRVETATPLYYDATCVDARPVRRISEGVIHTLLVLNGQQVGVLTLTWTACGRPPTKTWHRFDEGDRPTDRPTGGDANPR